MPHPPPRTRPRRLQRALGERRRRERRILALGLLVSAAVHLLAIGVAGDWLTVERESRPERPTTIVAEPPRGLRAVQIREVPSTPTEAPDDPAEPDEAEPEDRPPVPPREQPAVAAVTPDADTATAALRTAAERLAPRVVDPRLWRPVILIPREPTLEDVEARVAAAVELLSDSALAATEAAVRARDWTVEDAEGGKWGISPGKLHLGSLTLPIPVFSVTPDMYEREQMLWELEQQLDRTRFLESFESRVRAIRERRERERDEARSAGSGVGQGDG